MTSTELFLIVGVILLIVNVGLTLFKKTPANAGNIDFIKTNQELSKIEPLIRSEFSTSRTEIQNSSKEARNELSN